jgi:ABC-type transport system involved in cytochrome bd biosynthesis fused ATPase/permease subunit
VARGEIRFEDVRFGYGRESGVIDGLTLTVRPGEKIGLIGRSDAGKSTVVNLLLRFFDLEGGRILIDGQDIAAVTQESSLRWMRQGSTAWRNSIASSARFRGDERRWQRLHAIGMPLGRRYTCSSNPVIGFTAALSGNTLLASTVSSTRR